LKTIFKIDVYLVCVVTSQLGDYFRPIQNSEEPK
jgi:hypothetical protein